MSMAKITIPKAPYLLPNGLLHCEPCSATWNPEANLVRGWRVRTQDTTPNDNFHATSTVPKGECPWCRTKITTPIAER